jgi:hypothetical protein
MGQTDPRQVDIFLERFPGPVTLYHGWQKKLAGFVILLGLAVFSVCLLFSDRIDGWYETMMTVLSIVVCSALTARCAVMLLFPGTASLRLDADGFTVCGIFKDVRADWRDVSGIRVDARNRMQMRLVTYEVLAPNTRSPGGVTRITRLLSSNYRLALDDLAALMKEWQQRAIREKSAPVTHIPAIREHGPA